jgi:hypothetical protein
VSSSLVQCGATHSPGWNVASFDCAFTPLCPALPLAVPPDMGSCGESDALNWYPLRYLVGCSVRYLVRCSVRYLVGCSVRYLVRVFSRTFEMYYSHCTALPFLSSTSRSNDFSPSLFPSVFLLYFPLLSFSLLCRFCLCLEGAHSGRGRPFYSGQVVPNRTGNSYAERLDC